MNGVAFNNTGSVAVQDTQDNGFFGTNAGGISSGTITGTALSRMGFDGGYIFTPTSSITSTGEVGFGNGSSGLNASFAGTYDVSGTTQIEGAVDISGSVISPMTDLIIDEGQANFHSNAITTQTMEMLEGATFVSQADLTINQGLTWQGQGTIVAAAERSIFHRDRCR